MKSLGSRKNMPRIGVILAVALGLTSGCATIPDSIKLDNAAPLSVSQVQQAAAQYSGQTVRWGGRIIALENHKDHTLVEVLSRPLADNARPQDQRSGDGRFLARIDAFIDPAELPQGRSLTVVGVLGETVKRDVGDFPYVYPLVTVKNHYLWPKPVESAPYGVYPPYYYHPFYRPFYAPYHGPYFPAPFWHPHPYFW